MLEIILHDKRMCYSKEQDEFQVIHRIHYQRTCSMVKHQERSLCRTCPAQHLRPRLCRTRFVSSLGFIKTKSGCDNGITTSWTRTNDLCLYDESVASR